MCPLTSERLLSGSRESGADPHVATLATGAGTSLVGKVTGRALHVLTLVVLARLLGPAGFGLYAVGWTVLRLTGLIAALGLNSGVIRFGARLWKKEPARFSGVVRRSVSMSLLSGTVAGAVLFSLASFLSQQVFHEPDLKIVFQVFATAFPFAAGLRVAAAATRISRRMEFSVYAEELSQPLANLALVLLFSLLGWRLLGAVSAAVASFVIAFVVAILLLGRAFPELTSQQARPRFPFREILLFSLSASVAESLGILNLWLDRLFVAFFLPSFEVGVYHATSQASMLFALILASFAAIFSPMIAECHAAGDMARLESLFRISTKWTLYVSLPFFVVICSAPQELLTVIFGADYAPGAVPLVVLTLGQVPNVATGAVAPLLVMTGHQRFWLLLSATAVLLNAVLNFLLIPRWGLSGAAFATAATISLLFTLGLFWVRRVLGLWPYDRRYLKGLQAALVSVIAVALLSQVNVGSPALRLLLTAVLSFGSFGIALHALGLDSEDHELIRLIRTRLK